MMLKPRHRIAVTTASRISLAVADVFLILLTWSRLRLRSEDVVSKNRSFASVLMRDGEFR